MEDVSTTSLAEDLAGVYQQLVTVPHPALDQRFRPLFTEERRAAVARKIYTDIADWETRIVCLHAGDGHDPLKGTLYCAAILQTDALAIGRRKILYEALSYTWGEAVFSHPIQINDQAFSITSNLYSALTQLRKPDEDRYIWVDALCIDQSNLEEKAIQIPKIFTIYQKAKHVIAWLGDEGTFSRHAVHLVKRFNPAAEDIPGELQSISREDFLKACTGLFDILGRPWLRRAWVVQEVFAAKSIVVHIGCHTMEWDSLLNIHEWLKTLKTAETSSYSTKIWTEPIPTMLPDLQQLTWPLLHLRGVKESADRGCPELGSLLLDAGHLQASDDRDRVYALLGLTNVPVVQGDSIQHHESVHIDYKAPVSDVYGHIALFIMNSEKSISLIYSLDPLSIGIGRSPHCRCKNARHVDLTPLSIPSWTPDWRCFKSDLEDRTKPQMADWWTLQMTSHWWTPQSGNCLKLRGLRIGRVDSIVPISSYVSLNRKHGSQEQYCEWAINAHYSDALQAVDPFHVLLYGQNESTRPSKWNDLDMHVMRTFKQYHRGGDSFLEWYSLLGVLSQWKLDSGLRSTCWLIPTEPKYDDVLVIPVGGLFPLVLRPRSGYGYELVTYAEPWFGPDNWEPELQNERDFRQQMVVMCCGILKYVVEGRFFTEYLEEFSIF